MSARASILHRSGTGSPARAAASGAAAASSAAPGTALATDSATLRRAISPGVTCTACPPPRPAPQVRETRDAARVSDGQPRSNATVELLADGVPRSKAAVVEALAGRHDKQDVVHALIRLAVTGQVEETGGKYALAAAEMS